MKNKKGFTLIEIIGAIVILGIIAIIAFATYSSSLRGFRDNYYEGVERTLEESGEEFFNDNRNYRPTYPLVAAELPVNTLETKNYLNKVTDYNGNACSSRSYVMIVKEGKNEYSYHACLICDEDAYDNTDDMYCGKTWLDPTKVEYGLGTPETLYVYKGTTRDELKDALELPISYVRKDVAGNVIKEIRGTGEGEPTILPNNIDVVNTAVEGTYKVEYEYREEKANRNVVVYENKSPMVTYEKEQTVATTLAGATTKQKNTYVGGTWAQNVIVTLNSNTYTEPGVTTSRYQWNKDGIWQDFCTTDPCTVKVTTEMNQTVQFRLVDSNGNISRVTNPIVFKIDNTKPSCSLRIPTEISDNNWYNRDVTIEFNTKGDATSAGTSYDGVIRSEYVRYNVQLSSEALVRNATTNSNVRSTDGASITYIGYIEDVAENFNTCSITFKRDATPPQCGYTLSGSVGWDNWYVGNVGVTISTHTDNLSGVANNGQAYGTGSITGSKSFTHSDNTSGVSYTGHIRDNAGNTNTCSTSFKKDSTNPSCTIAKSHTWETGGVTLSVTCSDGNGPAGCNAANSQTGGSGLGNGTYTYRVYDNAGNTNTCSETVYYQIQRADRSCNYANRCSNAAAGCEQWNNCEDAACGVYQYNYCQNSACGTYSCNAHDCNCTTGYSSSTVTGGYDESEGSYGDDLYVRCYQSTSCYTGWCCTVYRKYTSCSTCYDQCTSSCRTSGCGVESYNSCRTSGCGCEYYHRDLGNCGCESWTAYGNWYNVSSCSTNTNNHVSSNNICRTLYY